MKRRKRIISNKLFILCNILYKLVLFGSDLGGEFILFYSFRDERETESFPFFSFGADRPADRTKSFSKDFPVRGVN